MPTKFDFQLIRDKFSNLNKKKAVKIFAVNLIPREKKRPRVHQEGVERSVLLRREVFLTSRGKSYHTRGRQFKIYFIIHEVFLGAHFFPKPYQIHEFPSGVLYREVMSKFSTMVYILHWIGGKSENKLCGGMVELKIKIISIHSHPGHGQWRAD